MFWLKTRLKRTAKVIGSLRDKAGRSQSPTVVMKRVSLFASVFVLAIGQADFESFRHAIKRAPVNSHNLGGVRSTAAGYFQDMQQVAAFEFIERRQVIKQ